MSDGVDQYMYEPVSYPALTIVDLADEAAKVMETYRNTVIHRIDNSCLRLAVFEGEYKWHKHPTSDELFIVIDRYLVIDLENGSELRLSKWQSLTIPAGTIHRTRAIGRTVNLCFELTACDTVFIEDR